MLVNLLLFSSVGFGQVEKQSKQLVFKFSG